MGQAHVHTLNVLNQLGATTKYTQWLCITRWVHITSKLTSATRFVELHACIMMHDHA